MGKVRYFAAGPMGIIRGVVIVRRGDDVEIHPFRLVQGGEEIRFVAAVKFWECGGEAGRCAGATALAVRVR